MLLLGAGGCTGEEVHASPPTFRHPVNYSIFPLEEVLQLNILLLFLLELPTRLL